MPHASSKAGLCSVLIMTLIRIMRSLSFLPLIFTTFVIAQDVFDDSLSPNIFDDHVPANDPMDAFVLADGSSPTDGSLHTDGSLLTGGSLPTDGASLADGSLFMDDTLDSESTKDHDLFANSDLSDLPSCHTESPDPQVVSRVRARDDRDICPAATSPAPFQGGLLEELGRKFRELFPGAPPRELQPADLDEPKNLAPWYKADNHQCNLAYSNRLCCRRRSPAISTWVYPGWPVDPVNAVVTYKHYELCLLGMFFNMPFCRIL